MPVIINNPKEYVKQTASVTTTGSAGSATGNTNFASKVRGVLKEVHVNYHASTPATADLTISYVDPVSGMTVPILVQANSTTDKVYYPRKLADKAADGSASALTEFPFEFVDWTTINVALAGADALTGAVVVTIVMETRPQRFWDGVYQP